MSNLFVSLFQIAFRPKAAFANPVHGQHSVKWLYALNIAIMVVVDVIVNPQKFALQDFSMYSILGIIASALTALIALFILMSLTRAIFDQNYANPGRLFSIKAEPNKPAIKEFLSYALLIQLLYLLISCSLAQLLLLIPLYSKPVILALDALCGIFVCLRLIAFGKIRYGIVSFRFKASIFLFRVLIGIMYAVVQMRMIL